MIILSDSNRLIVSFKFPPDDDISGIVVAKRIIVDGSRVDVLQNGMDDESAYFEAVDEFINERLYTSVDAKRDSVDCIFDYISQGMDLIDDRDYDEIYSRSWYMSNHYLALEYKFTHPNVKWTAEFSDPVLLNMKGNVKNYKSAVLDRPEYIDKVNSRISHLNESQNADFKLLDNPNNTFYMAEYLTFLFADRIIFTNENQRDIILKSHEELRDHVMEKSEIIPHPTLDSKYYQLRQSDMELDENDINIAYFGGFYYILRHFESLFYAYESLNHKHKDRIRFHLFLNDDEFINILIEPLEFKDNIIIRKPLEYFEFLNATTKFDILLVNDTVTGESFEFNPYLPSKISDYKGSGRDIWAIYEDKSTLSRLDVRYKSDLSDYSQSRDVLVDILKDYGYDDADYSFDDEYYAKRVTDLNKIIKAEFDAKNKLEAKNARLTKQIKKLKEQNKRLEEENASMQSSNSWKITKPLRSLKNRK